MNSHPFYKPPKNSKQSVILRVRLASNPEFNLTGPGLSFKFFDSNYSLENLISTTRVDTCFSCSSSAQQLMPFICVLSREEGRPRKDNQCLAWGDRHERRKATPPTMVQPPMANEGEKGHEQQVNSSTSARKLVDSSGSVIRCWSLWFMCHWSDYSFKLLFFSEQNIHLLNSPSFSRPRHLNNSF